MNSPHADAYTSAREGQRLAGTRNVYGLFKLALLGQVRTHVTPASPVRFHRDDCIAVGRSVPAVAAGSEGL